MDTKVESPPDSFGHEDRNFLTFGRALLSNSYVQVNRQAQDSSAKKAESKQCGRLQEENQ